MEVNLKSCIYQDYTALLQGMEKMDNFLLERRATYEAIKKLPKRPPRGGQPNSREVGLPALNRAESTPNPTCEHTTTPAHMEVYDRLLRMRAEEERYEQWANESFPPIPRQMGFQGKGQVHKPRSPYKGRLLPARIVPEDGGKLEPEVGVATCIQIKHNHLYIGSPRRAMSKFGVALENYDTEGDAPGKTRDRLPPAFKLPHKPDGVTPIERQENFSNQETRKYINFCTPIITKNGSKALSASSSLGWSGEFDRFSVDWSRHDSKSRPYEHGKAARKEDAYKGICSRQARRYFQTSYEVKHLMPLTTAEKLSMGMNIRGRIISPNKKTYGGRGGREDTNIRDMYCGTNVNNHSVAPAAATRNNNNNNSSSANVDFEREGSQLVVSLPELDDSSKRGDDQYSSSGEHNVRVTDTDNTPGGSWGFQNDVASIGS